jgi:hypothetical protein
LFYKGFVELFGWQHSGNRWQHVAPENSEESVKKSQLIVSKVLTELKPSQSLSIRHLEQRLKAEG